MRIERGRPHVRPDIGLECPDHVQLVAVCEIDGARVHSTGQLLQQPSTFTGLLQQCSLPVRPVYGHGIGPDHERCMSRNSALRVAHRELRVQLVKDGELEVEHGRNVREPRSCSNNELAGVDART